MFNDRSSFSSSAKSSRGGRYDADTDHPPDQTAKPTIVTARKVSPLINRGEKADGLRGVYEALRKALHPSRGVVVEGRMGPVASEIQPK